MTRFCNPILAALALCLACCGRQQSKGPLKAAGPTAVTVKAVQTVKWDRTVEIVGTLYPKDEASLAAEVEGSVERTFVEFGDRVAEGKELAVIDGASYLAQKEQADGNVARAEANLANARQLFARNQALQKSGTVTPREMDEGTAQVSQWEAELKAAKGAQAIARLNLDRAHVKAPFDGAISQRIVGRGDFVRPGTLLFKIVNDRVLKFIFAVPERYASFVRKELPVSFSVDNYPGKVFDNGKVYLISPTVSTDSRMFNVGALVDNASLELKASTFARGRIKLESGVAVLVVPVEAVVSLAGATKVFVIENNVARARAVEGGRIENGVQEVTGEIKEGEIVAVTGLRTLSDGAPVTVSEK